MQSKVEFIDKCYFMIHVHTTYVIEWSNVKNKVTLNTFI